MSDRDGTLTSKCRKLRMKLLEVVSKHDMVIDLCARFCALVARYEGRPCVLAKLSSQRKGRRSFATFLYMLNPWGLKRQVI